MAIRAKLRRIGSSLGVILPKKELELHRFHEGDIIEIPRLSRTTTRDLFGVWRDRPAKLVPAAGRGGSA